jgi:hypothetical protein
VREAHTDLTAMSCRFHGAFHNRPEPCELACALLDDRRKLFHEGIDEKDDLSLRVFGIARAFGQ